ncbi:MAG: translation initiation factor IF-3 [Planctomycetaceae bacterium]|jgi:translation initiation factor IF-3|nr:translation initiation factor IF-3 [Planctomycetaceae bacterium]
MVLRRIDNQRDVKTSAAVTNGKQRINEMIRVPQVRLVSADGEQLGVLNTSEALNKAKSMGLDLVEVSTDSKPPVCRIMDYGKYKYQQKKKQAKQHTHQSKTKEVWLHPKTGEHDILVKVAKAREFLTKNKDKVQITVKFKGRELAHMEEGAKVLNKMVEALDDVGKIESPPKRANRQIVCTLAPK